MSLGGLKVALVHDEFVRKGGAETVCEELLRMFPQAHVFALYTSNNPYITVDGRRYRIRPTFLQRFPLWFRKHPKRLAPLLLHAAERLDLSSYDVVISSSSAFAKGVVTRSHVPHLSYCHTPTRYVWERRSHNPIETGIQHILKVADFAAAQRPDAFIANSHYTQARIAKYYRRDSKIIYPPVSTDFFSPGTSSARGNHFLCVGRLTPAKYFEQAIIVCEKLRMPLRIVGVGHHEKILKRMTGRYTTFVGKISQEKLRAEYRQARALLQPGIEDFGIVSVEALACGTPVIAVGQGGVLEIVDNMRHGISYPEPIPELLADAIRQFIAVESRLSPMELQQRAFRFSRSRFSTEIMRTVEEVLLKQQTEYRSVHYS